MSFATVSLVCLSVLVGLGEWSGALPYSLFSHGTVILLSLPNLLGFGYHLRYLLIGAKTFFLVIAAPYLSAETADRCMFVSERLEGGST